METSVRSQQEHISATFEPEVVKLRQFLGRIMDIQVKGIYRGGRRIINLQNEKTSLSLSTTSLNIEKHSAKNHNPHLADRIVSCNRKIAS